MVALLVAVIAAAAAVGSTFFAWRVYRADQRDRALSRYSRAVAPLRGLLVRVSTASAIPETGLTGLLPDSDAAALIALELDQDATVRRLALGLGPRVSEFMLALHRYPPAATDGTDTGPQLTYRVEVLAPLADRIKADGAELEDAMRRALRVGD